MKIDMHVHVTPPEIINNLEKYCSKDPYFSLLSHSPKNKFATAENIVAEMQRVGFDRAVVFGFAFNGSIAGFNNRSGFPVHPLLEYNFGFELFYGIFHETKSVIVDIVALIYFYGCDTLLHKLSWSIIIVVCQIFI